MEYFLSPRHAMHVMHANQKSGKIVVDTTFKSKFEKKEKKRTTSRISRYTFTPRKRASGFHEKFRLVGMIIINKGSKKRKSTKLKKKM